MANQTVTGNEKIRPSQTCEQSEKAVSAAAQTSKGKMLSSPTDSQSPPKATIELQSQSPMVAAA